MSNKIGCFLISLIFVFNVTVGAWSINEILSWFGKNIPLWADALIGLFTAEFSIPVAIIGYILKACGVF